MRENTTVRQETDTREQGDCGDAVEMVGETTISVVPRILSEHPLVERVCTVACASGDRTTARWKGVEVLTLLDRTDAPAATTHIRVHSDDGYCACLALQAASTALLATERDGQSLDEVEAYATRLVGPSVAGERAVKGVTRIEALALDPDDDPTDLERLSLDDPAYG